MGPRPRSHPIGGTGRPGGGGPAMSRPSPPIRAIPIGGTGLAESLSKTLIFPYMDGDGDGDGDGDSESDGDGDRDGGLRRQKRRWQSNG